MDSLIIKQGKDFESYINRFICISEKYDICKNKLNIVGTNIDETNKEMKDLEQNCKNIAVDVQNEYLGCTLFNATIGAFALLNNAKYKYKSMIHGTTHIDYSLLNSYHYYRISELEKKMKKIDYESRIETLETHIDDTDDLQIEIHELENKYAFLEEENKNLKNEISDLKNLLTEKGIIDKPVPIYNYINIANRILPFKKELMTVTKWINKNALPVAIPVKFV